MKTITVKDLIAALTEITNESDRQVRVWLPGSTIALSSVWMRNGTVMIEGNIDEGSALLAHEK